VRVHEEVREYGMVVDPSCMKCLDCVSVCPNDALYFGFAKPSIMKAAAKHATPKRHWDLSWPEELAMAGVFAASFFAVRGPVPLLMAAGVAGVVTYLAWKLWRLVRDESVNLHRFRLKYKGTLQRSGFVFAAGAVLAIALTAHSGSVKSLQFVAQRFDNRVTIPPQYVFGEDRMEMPSPMAADARRAIEFYGLASSVREGGIGLVETHQTQIDNRLVWLHSTLGEFDEADRILHRAARRDGLTEEIASSLAIVNLSRRSVPETIDFYERTLRDHAEYERLQDQYIAWLVQIQDTEKALAASRAALQRLPDSLLTMRRLSMLETVYGDIDRGIELTKRTIQIDPKSPFAYAHLSEAYRQKGDTAAALEAMQQAAALAPEGPVINESMAALLEEVGRTVEADVYQRKAQELRAKLSDQAPPAQ
jgi:tetratricopeptide (TPR) repeat protein